MNAQEVENDVRRILRRLQGALAKTSHAATGEEDVVKRWSYIDYLQNQLTLLREAYKDDPQALTRVNEYADKIEFCTQLMLSSEGLRPSFMTSIPTVSSPRTKTEDHTLRKQALSAEEVRTRFELLGPDSVSPEIRPRGLGTEAELRRRLGLSTVIKTNASSKVDVAEQLVEDEKTRDMLETDVLKLLESLRENSIQVQRSLENDAVRIDTVDDLLTKNSADVRKEIERVDTLFKTTAMSCRANCALISTVIAIWIGVYIVMKITPRPA